MLYAWSVRLAKNILYPLNPLPFSQATMSHPEKARSYEKKIKSHYFANLAKDTTNSHPHFKKEWGYEKKKET